MIKDFPTIVEIIFNDKTMTDNGGSSQHYENIVAVFGPESNRESIAESIAEQIKNYFDNKGISGIEVSITSFDGTSTNEPVGYTIDNSPSLEEITDFCLYAEDVITKYKTERLTAMTEILYKTRDLTISKRSTTGGDIYDFVVRDVARSEHCIAAKSGRGENFESAYQSYMRDSCGDETFVSWVKHQLLSLS